MADALWGDEAIAETVATAGLNRGVEADLPDWARFVRRVREALLARVMQHEEPGRVLYLLAEPDDVNVEDAIPFHRIHTGAIDPSEQIWLVGATVRSGRAIRLHQPTTQTMFDHVIDVLEMGSAPAVYYDTDTTPHTMTWYPLGVKDGDFLHEAPLAHGHVPSVEELLSVIDRVHKFNFLTRYNQNDDTTLWKDAEKYRVHGRAERRVQNLLLAGLGGAFSEPFFVNQEERGHTGRYDIAFLERGDDGAVKVHAVLELKVARSFGSGGSSYSQAANEAAIRSGIEQARAYCDEVEASDAACLLFDLRKQEDQGLPSAVEARASQLEVVLKAWSCFPTAEHYRKFVVPS